MDFFSRAEAKLIASKGNDLDELLLGCVGHGASLADGGLVVGGSVVVGAGHRGGPARSQ